MLAALALLLGLAPQTAVNRCVGPGGTPVFTDQPCSALHASAAGPAGAVPARREHACPRDRQALKERVAAAFASHDANALAGLMLWDGYGARSAVRDVEGLRTLVRRPLAGFDDDVRVYAVDVPSQTAVDASDTEADLALQLGGIDPGDGREVRFGVDTRAACLWLRP